MSGEVKRRMSTEDGPTDRASATPVVGDPDAHDAATDAEVGGVAGAVSGTMLAGPVGGIVGATLGALAGSGAAGVDDEEVSSPGREVREPYGHPVRVRSRRETGRDARGSQSEEPGDPSDAGNGAARPADADRSARDDDEPMQLPRAGGRC